MQTSQAFLHKLLGNAQSIDNEKHKRNGKGMKSGEIVAFIIIVGVIALALGTTIGYSLSSGRTFTVTQSGKTSTMTTTNGTLFPQSTTYTTVSQTTLSFGGSTYATTTGEYSGCIPPVQCYLTTVTTVNYLSTSPPNSTSTTSESSLSSSNSISISSVGSETFVTFETTIGINTTVGGATFVYPISINYNGGPWLLHYWVQNYSGTQNSISGNLIGSVNSSIWITFYVSGYVEYTLCASATKMPNDSPRQFDLPLTLAVFNQNETAIGSNSTVEVCGTMGV